MFPAGRCSDEAGGRVGEADQVDWIRAIEGRYSG